jgi:hypothetical protein
MKGSVKAIVVFVCLLLIAHQPAGGQPTFQVWSPEWSFAGDYHYWPAPEVDEDTWFVTASTFELWAIGAYHNESALTDGHLIMSVPDGQAGTITITGLYGTPDPGAGVRYDTLSFLPANFNNHYPLKDDVSDFIVFEIGDFANNPEDIYDYNADDGSITLTNSTGEVKEYSVEAGDFDWVHIDLYGFTGRKWEINPASHDLTRIVPIPAAGLLAAFGAGLVVVLKRSRRI